MRNSNRCIAARRFTYHSQSGVALVEMAILSSVFLLILLSSIEVSRLLFTWHSLEAAMQRGARLAVVCPRDHPAIRRVAMFGAPDQEAGTLLPGFDESNIQIRYLDEDGAVSGALFPEFVELSVVDYTHELAIPFLGERSSVQSPTFTTTLSGESMGYVPDDDSFRCFG